MNAVQPQVRSLTDEEVATFHEKGWVFLPGYLDADYAGALAERCYEYFG
jgi:hypothetical protein